MGAQTRHRQARFRPGGEHEMESKRCMFDEPAHTGAGRFAGDPVEVVQNQRDLALTVQLVDQSRQNQINDRRYDRNTLPPDLATSGFARRRAPMACDHRTTGSLSRSSSVSHATGLREVSDLYQAERRVVFPKPAGQATRVSLRFGSPSKILQKALTWDRLFMHVPAAAASCPPGSAARHPRDLQRPTPESCSSGVSCGASGST